MNIYINLLSFCFVPGKKNTILDNSGQNHVNIGYDICGVFLSTLNCHGVVYFNKSEWNFELRRLENPQHFGE